MTISRLLAFAITLATFCICDPARANQTADEIKARRPVPLIVTYDNGETSEDTRIHYELELLRLALDKTSTEYGPYKLLPSPHSMNYHRALVALKNNQYENFIRSFAYRKLRSEDSDLIYIPFPIDLGLLGYRICFVSKDSKKGVEQASSLAELKQFTHGQGVKWVDASILETQGFKVIESASYEGLFKMININRIDLFCRGIGELQKEYARYKHLQNLEVDNSFALHYPLPLYFMIHKNNHNLQHRVEAGLITAFNDGSLLKLWHKHFQESIDFAKLSNRKIYKLKNHTLEGLPDKYSQYFIDITKL